MTDAKTLARKASALKAIKDAATAAYNDTRLRLESALDPGDRKGATAPDGRDIGTVSYSKTNPNASVTDPAALFEWVKANAPSEVWTGADFIDRNKALEFLIDNELWNLVELHDEVRPAYVETLCAKAVKSKGADVPPGITYTAGGYGGNVSVRQSDEQKQNLLDYWVSDGAVQLVEILSSPPQIEAADEDPCPECGQRGPGTHTLDGRCTS